MFLTRKELSASPQCTQSQDTPVIISSICELQETAPKGVNVEAARLMSVLLAAKCVRRQQNVAGQYWCATPAMVLLSYA